MEENKEFHTKTLYWNNNIETILKEIEQSCRKYKWITLYTSEKCTEYYNILMYIMIFIGPISGILSTISVSNPSHLAIIQIFITIFSFISGVLSAIIKYSKLEQNSSLQQSIAIKYANLESNIKRQLSLNEQDRVNPGEYLEWVTKTFDELFGSLPIVGDNFPKEKKKSEKEITENDNSQSSIIDIIQKQVINNKFNDGKMDYELSRLNRSN